MDAADCAGGSCGAERAVPCSGEARAPRRPGRDERRARDCSRLVCSRLLGEALAAACGACSISFRVAEGIIMGMPAAAFWLLGPILAGASPEQGPAPEERLVRFEFEETHMASPFKIVLYSTDPATARRASRAAFDRIAALNRS